MIFRETGSDEATGLSSPGTERGSDLIPSCHTGKVDQIKPGQPPGHIYGDKVRIKWWAQTCESQEMDSSRQTRREQLKCS